MEELRPWLLAGFSGILLTLSFPPIGFWALAWVSLVPLLSAVKRAPDAKTAANLGAVAGLVFYPASLFWLVKVFGPFAAAFWCVFALWLALYSAFLWQRRENGAQWIALAGILWTGIEYFRAEVWPLNCSWLSLGYSQVPNLPLLQLCSVIGVHGLSAVIASFNAALVLRRVKPAAAFAAALLCAWAWGRARLSAPLDGTPVSVALVQDERYDIDRLSKFSLEPEARKAQLLVWPEYAFTVNPGQEASYVKLLARKLSGSSAVAVLGGAIFPEDMKKGKEENFAWVLSPEGRLLGRYDKHHPIPYVERLLPANPSPHVIATPLGPLGVQICYDLDFEDGTRRLVREGARLLAVPNLDPSDWPSFQHRQHSDMSPVRAVESGLWIARAASSGISQIIDPYGRVIAEMASNSSGVLTGPARLRDPGTIYSSWGWVIAPFFLGATVLLAALRVL